MEERIFAAAIGVFFVIVGVICARLIPRTDRARTALSERLVPRRFRRGLNAYSKFMYTGFCIASVLVGLFFVYVGLSDRVRGW